MPNADLILPGFYGKLPRAGDFVTRRLPHDFVQTWDRWLAKHLAPLINSEMWDVDTPLRFLSGPSALGLVTGVVVASGDRVGRRFPLSAVALLPEAASVGLVKTRQAWFVEVERALKDAQQGRLMPDELDRTLSGMPLVLDASSGDGERVDALIVWTETSDIYDVDPEAPDATLLTVLSMSLETS